MSLFNNTNSKGREYDLNTMLQFVNALVVVAILYIYFGTSQHNPYVDGTTVMWGFVLALQVGLVLMVEKRARNPLLILLAMNIIANYIARVLTLQIYPMSGVLIMTRMGYPLDVQDINNTMPYIFFGTCAIVAGLLAPPLKFGLQDNGVSQNVGVPRRDVGQIIKPHIIMGLFAVSMLAGACFAFVKHLGDLNSAGDRVMSYINMLLCHDVVLLLVLAYLFTQKRRLTKRYFKMIVLMLGVYLLLRILQGSRSGMLLVAMTILSVWLTAYSRVKVKAKLVIIALIIVLPVSLISFSVATTIRQVSGAERDQAYDDEKMEEIKEMSMQRGYANSDHEFIMSMIFSRIAYLTDVTDVLSNRDRYGDLVNIERIGMSIVDSSTPGFDVFGAGRISNRLKNVYTHQSLDYQYAANEYQSDALTVFGEYFTLFRGYAGLIPIFLLSYFFRIVYLYVRSRWGKDGFCSISYGALTLIIFRLWIDSYGTDWVILEGGRMVVMSMVFISFITYLSKKRIVIGWDLKGRDKCAVAKS